METIAAILIPFLLGIAVLRILAMPLKWFLRLAVHGLGGFLCLWLLNTVSCFTGVAFSLNTVTVSAAGFLGIPGIALLTLLELMA